MKRGKYVLTPQGWVHELKKICWKAGLVIAALGLSGIIMPWIWARLAWNFWILMGWEVSPEGPTLVIPTLGGWTFGIGVFLFLACLTKQRHH